MDDPFLKATGVSSEASAMSNAIQSSLQRNKTYKDSSSDAERERFRTELAKQIRTEAQRYNLAVSENEHCEAIRRISDAISKTCGHSLVNSRLRYGTAQKAFNLYLKFLWRLGRAAKPPHCPVDSVVLAAADVDGAWTKCVSESQYLDWIKQLKRKARPLELSEWEYKVWLQNAVTPQAVCCR